MIKIVVRENAIWRKVHLCFDVLLYDTIAKHLIELNIPYSQDEAKSARESRKSKKKRHNSDDIQKQAVQGCFKWIDGYYGRTERKDNNY